MSYDELSPDYMAAGPLTGVLTVHDPITGLKRRVVYQRTSAQFANARTPQHERLQLRVEYGGRKGNTAQQQGQRAAFATAVAIWQQMTPAQRRSWETEKRNAQATISTYHFFMSRYMKENPTPQQEN